MNDKEFEKQQLEQLISDLKDIDKYTSFKNGAFIYDLGKYQGSLLVNHINNLQSKIDKAIDKLESLLPICIMPNNMLIHGTEKAKTIKETLDILKEDK